MINIILLVDDYINDIKKTTSFLNYQKYFNKVNKLHLNKLNDLNESKIKFDEVSKYGTNHPDYKEQALKYQTLRVNYYNLTDVKNLRKYQKEVEDMVNSFLTKLSKEISSNIPVVNELGLVINDLGGISCGNC